VTRLLIRRRVFASCATALVATWAISVFSHAARAQQSPSLRHIGVVLVNLSLLVGQSPEGKEVEKFREGLLDAGYVEGRDVVIEWRSANGDYARVGELVADLVQRKVDVIVVETTPAALAAKRATSTIRVVMTLVADPVGFGLVASLTHPGGNLTGLSLMYTDISAKRLQLIKEAISRVTRVAVLWNPDNPYHRKAVEDLKAVAPTSSLELHFSAQTPEEFAPAFSAVSRARAEALYVIDDALFVNHRTTLLEMASMARLPTMHGQRQFVDEGAFISYGPNFGDLYRRSAGYVEKILKGAKPSDMPIGQPLKFELVVNVKTAKARHNHARVNPPASGRVIRDCAAQ